MSRHVPFINGSREYIEGTWMVAAEDRAGPGNVYLVGPNPCVRLCVEITGGTMADQVLLARQIAERLNSTAVEVDDVR